MKIKKLFCLLAAGVVAVSAFASNSFAYYSRSYTDENVITRKARVGNFTYVLKDYAQYGAVYISKVATVVNIPNIEKVEIPEKVTYKGTEFTVTDLDMMNAEPYPYNKYNKVEEIILPESIYNISSFSGFKNLKKMNLPKNTMLGRWDEHEIYSDWADFCDIMHLSYLKQCPKLKLSVDPNNQHYCFKNDFLLTKDEKEIIMSFNKRTDVIIPDGVEKIIDYGGVGFKHVKNVKFPDTLKHLSGTWNSLESIELPSKLEILGGNFGKSKFTKVVIPDSVKVIYTYAFDGSNLKSVKLGKGLTAITNNVFSNCNNLKSITIPKNIKEINNHAFENCKNLRKVNIRSNNVDIFPGAFSNCKKLKSVTINGAERIDARAFESCNNLTNIKINNSKISLTIEEEAFYNCKKLKSVTISGVKKIYANAFYNCKKLSKITIKNKKKAPKVLSGIKGSFKNTKKGIKFVVKNKKVAKQLKKQLSKKKFKNSLKSAKILIGKKVVYKI